jgi:hypothetical protein
LCGHISTVQMGNNQPEERRSAASSTSGKLPATNSSRSRSLHSLCTLYSLYSLYSLSTRAARRPEVFGRFPCRRHRKSPG